MNLELNDVLENKMPCNAKSSNAQDRSSDKTSNAKNSSNSTNRKGNTQCK